MRKEHAKLKAYSLCRSSVYFSQESKAVHYLTPISYIPAQAELLIQQSNAQVCSIRWEVSRNAVVNTAKEGDHSDWTLDSLPGVAALIPWSTIWFRSVVLEFQFLLEVAKFCKSWFLIYSNAVLKLFVHEAWLCSGWVFWFSFMMNASDNLLLWHE